MSNPQPEETVSRSSAVRAFLSDMIDYAGLFPPAELGLRQAVDNYSLYRSAPPAWMLARFVVPAARLTDMVALAPRFDADGAGRLSVLSASAGSLEGLETQLHVDINSMRTAERRTDGRLICEAMELRTNGLFFQERNRIADLISGTRAAVIESGYKSLELYFEVPWDGSDAAWVEALIHALAETESSDVFHPGIKIRTGGDQAAMIPDSASLARIVALCAQCRVPFKATAGLHHPVRHFDDRLGTSMHGFLNLFGSAILAYVHSLSTTEIMEILSEDEPGAFRFGQDLFAWRGLSCETAQIQAARSIATSFGSCSFEEPVNDLSQLNII